MFETAEIAQIDLNELSNLFGSDTPDNTADTTKTEDVKTEDVPFDTLPEITDDVLNQLDEETVDKTKDTDADKTKEDVKDTPTTDADKDKTKEDEGSTVDKEQISTVLANTVEYLISQGLWSDFDGRSDLKIDEATYAELAAKQTQHMAYSIVDELINETGDYGKAIISHIKAGGNPDEIIDLFKEQKSIETYDTSDESGKQGLIEKYYKEVLGWKPEKVNKIVKRLVEDNEIESEFTEVKEHYDKHYQERLEKVQEDQRNAEKEQRSRQQAFINNIRTALKEESNIPEKDKAVIASSILDFKHKLDNGQKVNDFYLKFSEMQNDPKQYIKLVRFVMNPEAYEQQLSKKKETEIAAKTFNFIKGNAAVSSPKNSDVSIEDKSKKKKEGTDFSFVFKK